MSSSISGEEDFAGTCRRRMLKSGLSGLIASVGAGLPAGRSASAQGAGGRTLAAPAASNNVPVALYKGMVAFMLAHEQFPAPELIRLGAAAEHAGFDLGT